MKELSLFSGGGGGILASHILGWDLVGVAEWDKAPREMLLARIKDGVIPPVNVYTDVQTIDPEEYRGKLDILSGGFPCQPFSTAGFQLGENDPRNMWPATHRLLVGSDIKHGFFENVYGLLTSVQNKPSYFGKIITNLVESGYIVTWMVVSAESVGAPHTRERVWILTRRVDAQNVPALPLRKIAYLRNDVWIDTSKNHLDNPALFSWPRSGLVIKNSAFELPHSSIPSLNDLHIFLQKLNSAGFNAKEETTITSKINPKWINSNISGNPTKYLTPTKWDSRRSRSNPTWYGSDLVCSITRLEECFGNIQPKAGGRLNPDWVEWLMGWPIGWTSLDAFNPEKLKAWESTSPNEWWDSEPNLPRLSPHSVNTGAKRIAALGNGQVPAAAVAATYRLDVILTNIERILENKIELHEAHDSFDYLLGIA